jgi:hypothetical protein
MTDLGSAMILHIRASIFTRWGLHPHDAPWPERRSNCCCHVRNLL